VPASISKEDQTLRQWTAIILRTVLLVATIVLVVGLLATVFAAPGYYVQRFRSAQEGRGHHQLEWSQMAAAAFHGDPHSIMTIGLLVLTLVPLGRVAFTFFFFAKQGDRVFAMATAYVLAALIAGVMLGRID